MMKKEPKSSQSVFSFLLKDKYYKLLKPFFNNPNSQFYVNQIKEITGLSPRIVVEELKNLEKEGILKSKKLANALFYELNAENPKTKLVEVVFK
jgi:predicted transcriptional regulator